MKNKIYYGEYTLKYWIKLLLNKDIVLPEYQRHFVWQERDVKRLIQSLKEGQFVQPVTIALYNDGTKKSNLILDGQQRLTSILLAFIGYFPDKRRFELEGAEQVAQEDDSATDDAAEVPNETQGILWKFSDMLMDNETKEELINRISHDDKYHRFQTNILEGINDIDSFFNNTFLGFSYVVPNSQTIAEVQENFSQLFRNINYFGKKLDALESRKSLYYQKQDLTQYFEGKCQNDVDVLVGLKIREGFQPYKIDFVRYLSILSQFYCSHNKDGRNVLVGYSAYSSRESFYADYVSYILGVEQEDRVNKFDGFNFSDTFPQDEWKQRFETLKQAISALKPTMHLNNDSLFSSWYEADYWLFGLMYHIIFEGKRLKDNLSRNVNDTVQTLQQEIIDEISLKQNNPYYVKNGNRLTNIRERLVKSYTIYLEYVQ